MESSTQLKQVVEAVAKLEDICKAIHVLHQKNPDTEPLRRLTEKCLAEGSEQTKSLKASQQTITNDTAYVSKIKNVLETAAGTIQNVRNDYDKSATLMERTRESLEKMTANPAKINEMWDVVVQRSNRLTQEQMELADEIVKFKNERAVHESRVTSAEQTLKDHGTLEEIVAKLKAREKTCEELASARVREVRESWSRKFNQTIGELDAREAETPKEYCRANGYALSIQQGIGTSLLEAGKMWKSKCESRTVLADLNRDQVVLAEKIAASKASVQRNSTTIQELQRQIQCNKADIRDVQSVLGRRHQTGHKRILPVPPPSYSLVDLARQCSPNPHNSSEATAGDQQPVPPLIADVWDRIIVEERMLAANRQALMDQLDSVMKKSMTKKGTRQSHLPEPMLDRNATATASNKEQCLLSAWKNINSVDFRHLEPNAEPPTYDYSRMCKKCDTGAASDPCLRVRWAS
ncbi:MAG: hypothetical protein Q9208_003581 [Pyrenodesmia sp. 3 TL-2023]